MFSAVHAQYFAPCLTYPACFLQTQSKKRMQAITVISAALFMAPMAFFEYLSLVSKQALLFLPRGQNYVVLYRDSYEQFRSNCSASAE